MSEIGQANPYLSLGSKQPLKPSGLVRNLGLSPEAAYFASQPTKKRQMKNLMFVCFMLCVSTVSSAQLDRARAETGAGFDVKKITQNIMATITSKVGLSSAQVSAVTPLISQFLTKKSSIMPMAKTHSSDYKSRFEAEQKTLFDKLKGSISADQFKKFLDLKPDQASSTDPISQLFF